MTEPFVPYMPAYTPDPARNDDFIAESDREQYGGAVLYLEHRRGGALLGRHSLYSFVHSDYPGDAEGWHQITLDVQAGDVVTIRPRPNTRDGEYDGPGPYGERDHTVTEHENRAYAVWDNYVIIT